MSMELFGITLQAWPLWKFFPLFLLLIGLLLWQMHKRSKILALLSAPKWRSSLVLHASFYTFLLKTILYTLGILFLFISLLQPAWGKKEEVIEQKGRDLIIALDVSKSMLAQDRKPNRLEFAKAKIKRLVRKLDCERVGLMLFSGSTIMQCPLTSDYKAFFMFLDQIDAQTISSGTTALDQAILKTINVFEKMPTKKHKLLVVFTDGEDFSSNLAGIKSKAIEMGLTIFTIGLGTLEGAPIPLYDEKGNQIGHQKDQKDAVVISRLNEGILRTLADETGGTYMRAQDDNRDIQRLIERVHEFEKEAFEDKHVSNLLERYPYFIAVAMFCFALEWLL